MLRDSEQIVWERKPRVEQFGRSILTKLSYTVMISSVIARTRASRSAVVNLFPIAQVVHMLLIAGAIGYIETSLHRGEIV